MYLERSKLNIFSNVIFINTSILSYAIIMLFEKNWLTEMS